MALVLQGRIQPFLWFAGNWGLFCSDWGEAFLISMELRNGGPDGPKRRRGEQRGGGHEQAGRLWNERKDSNGPPMQFGFAQGSGLGGSEQSFYAASRGVASLPRLQ